MRPRKKVFLVMTDPDIEKMLNTVTSRLDETITLFAASKAVSGQCHQEVDKQLFEYVNTNRFWRSVYAAFQISIFINIAALVDKRKDCSTLKTAADVLNEMKAGQVPQDLFTDLNIIHGRYKDFRHKIFAHTDHHRVALADEFDASGFTWESINDDIKLLDYICAVLWAIHLGRNIPSRDTVAAYFRHSHLEAQQISSEVTHLFSLIANNIKLD